MYGPLIRRPVHYYIKYFIYSPEETSAILDLAIARTGPTKGEYPVATASLLHLVTEKDRNSLTASFFGVLSLNATI